MKRLVWICLAALAGCFALTGCDRLDDDDGTLVSALLPGKWTFSYTFRDDADPGMEFGYKYVLFDADGSCALAYIDDYETITDDEGGTAVVPVYDALHGTWQATSAMIRIVSSDVDGEERIMLWRVISLSPKQLLLEYSFELKLQSYTAVVTLDKQE